MEVGEDKIAIGQEAQDGQWNAKSDRGMFYNIQSLTACGHFTDG